MVGAQFHLVAGESIDLAWSVFGPYGFGNRWFSVSMSGHERNVKIPGQRASRLRTSAAAEERRGFEPLSLRRYLRSLTCAVGERDGFQAIALRLDGLHARAPARGASGQRGRPRRHRTR